MILIVVPSLRARSEINTRHTPVAGRFFSRAYTFREPQSDRERDTERDRAGEERERWKVEMTETLFLIVFQWIKSLCLKTVETVTV